MQGNLENENLLVLLQTLGREQATGALSIVNPEHGEARVYFRDGRIVYAHRGSLHDHRLVLSILQDLRGNFQFVEKATPSVQTINQTLDNFLLELGRLRFAFGSGDQSDAQDMLDPNQVPRVLNPARLREMRFAADDNWLVLHLDGAHTVAQLIAMERREGQASALLKRLQNLGMVELPIPPVAGRRSSSSPVPTINVAQVPRVLDAERLTQMQFSIDEFHIIMNLDGQRSLRELSSFERTPGQLPSLISHLVTMGLLELNLPQTSAIPETAPQAVPSVGPESGTLSTSVSTSVNVDALPDLDPRAVPVVLDDVRIKETRFSADDNWLVIHFDGRTIEALSKLEKRRGQLKMLMHRLTSKNLVELRSPTSVSFSPTASPSQSLNTPQIPTLFESGRTSPLSFSADELALVLQIDGEKTIRDLRRFEGRQGQLESLLERLELEGVLELREAPLKLKAGISNDLTGMSMAVDQSVLESWERRLGRQVWRARIHFPGGLEHSCELMASTGADTFVLLSQDVVKGGGVKNGTGVKIYAE